MKALTRHKVSKVAMSRHTRGTMTLPKQNKCGPYINIHCIVAIARGHYERSKCITLCKLCVGDTV